MNEEENGCGKAALVTLLRHFRRLSVVTALSCLCLSLSSVYSFPKSEYVTENILVYIVWDKSIIEWHYNLFYMFGSLRWWYVRVE